MASFDPTQLAAATTAQTAAATDASPHVRVIAGPGTGKSFAIERRVAWLLDQGVAADKIVAVSFTRAAAADLSVRVVQACEAAGHDVAIRVGTLHSFALRALRAAGRLAAYPADPVVLGHVSEREQTQPCDNDRTMLGRRHDAAASGLG